MTTIILTIVAVLALAVAALLLIAASRPSSFAYETSAVIAAPAERIFPLITNLRAMNTWNPFNEDPAIKGTYSGPEHGPGSRYAFESRKSGSGYCEIADELPPSEVGMRLVMTRPFGCENRCVFRLVPVDGGTRVSWAMTGENKLMAKVMGVVIDCEKMCTRQFDRGLAKLKTMVESGNINPVTRVA